MGIATLKPQELRLSIDPQALGFADTSELSDEPLSWIGQARAQKAAAFGLSMDQPGYNLFVLGDVGSGRSTLMAQLMREQAALKQVPPDLCYLHNFDAPEHPRALRLPAGEGRLLRQLMAQFARKIEAEIPKRLADTDYKAESERISSAYKLEEERAYAELNAFAEARHFSVMREQGNLVLTYKDAQGEPLTATRLMALGSEQRAEIDAAEDSLRVEIGRFLDKTRALTHVMNDGLSALRRQTVKPLLDQEIQLIRNELRKQIKDTVKLGGYLEQVHRYVLDNLELFSPDDEEERVAALLELLSHFRVNVAVDNHDTQGAPVILEDNPLFRRLFGSIEYEVEDDMLATDFSRIRAGSLLRAHGGFLMLHLRDLLADEPVWEKFRRFLRSGRAQIEEPGMMYSPIASVTLQPEPIDVEVKIVLIASVQDYYAVQEGDPEFASHFRCKVDFAEAFRATPDSHHATAVFIAHVCRSRGLPHLGCDAVAAVIEDTHRQADDQTRQSAIFASCEALTLESAAVAQARGATVVAAADVHEAVLARMQRLNDPEERMLETLVDGERLLDVTGQRMGQVNGLTVIDMGDYRFGFPVRVTARTYAGGEGLLNIDREVKLSGPIHDKGVLILHSYLLALFGHMAPLALNAAVVFEQEYSGVEGDSASCAEFYALLSSLAEAPLRQGIAVTGALNQNGDVLPVGGINEKIEGYFRSCECLGLDGTQGVLMPARNRRHLMLAPHVVEAVAAGRFHLYTADHVSEGMELLTGLPFGQMSRFDGYPDDTVLGRAQKALHAFRLASSTPKRAVSPRRLSRLGRHGDRHGPEQ